jgi:hypothetical protein
MYPLWASSEALVLLPDRLRQLEERLGEPSVFRDDDGATHRVERLAAVGDAVVPQVAEYVGSCLLTWHERSSPPVEHQRKENAGR